MASDFPHLFVVGVTGAIGSGKSTVSQILAQHGAELLSADKLAHEVLTDPEVVQEIRKLFGDSVWDEEQRELIREKLADQVFCHPQKLRQLESLIHPRVRKKILQALEHWNREAEKQQKKKVVLLDIPLLFESPLHKICDHTVYVHTPLPQRLERVQKNRGWTQEELHRREAQQMPPEEKRRRADTTLANTGSLEELSQKVKHFWHSVLSPQLT